MNLNLHTVVALVAVVLFAVAAYVGASLCNKLIALGLALLTIALLLVR